MVPGTRGSPHLYWRVLFTNTPGSPKARNISRFQMHPVVSGVNVCITGNGQVSALTEAKPTRDFTFIAHNAVNNNPLTDWMSVKITNFDWIKWSFNAPHLIKEIQFTASNNSKYAGNAPQDFHLQWSDDDVNWTTVFTVLGEINWIPGEHRRYSQETITTTIGQTYANTGSSASSIAPFTDHLLAIEHDAASASGITVRRNEFTPLSQAESTAFANKFNIISTQYVSLGQAVERSFSKKITVKITVVLIVPTTETTSALPFTHKKTYEPILDNNFAYPITAVKTKATNECDCAFAFTLKRNYGFQIGFASCDNTAYSVDHLISEGIAQAVETETPYGIKKLKSTDIGIAATHSESSGIKANREYQLGLAASREEPYSINLIRSKHTGEVIEKDDALKIKINIPRSVALSTVSELDIANKVRRNNTITQSVDLETVHKVKIEKLYHSNNSPEKDAGLEIHVGRMINVPLSQAESLSSAQLMEYSIDVKRIGVAVSLHGMNPILHPAKPYIGVASEKDSRIELYNCPIPERDFAYPIKRGFPDHIDTTTELDEAHSISLRRYALVEIAAEKNTGLKIKFTRPVHQNQSYEHDYSQSITSSKLVPILMASAKSHAQTIDEVRLKTIRKVPERDLALRIYPPYSGTMKVSTERESALPASKNKAKGILQASELDSLFHINRVYIKELGTSLEGDIARLYKSFTTTHIFGADSPSSGLSVDPLRTVVLGQAASKDSGSGGVGYGNNVYIRLAKTKGESFPFYIHASDQFNQAIENEVGLYVNAVKSKSLKLAAEDDSTHVLANMLKAHGVNLGAEEDVALAIKTAFAYDFDLSEEKSTAGSISALKSRVLGFADSGAFAYALDRFLKVQGLNSAPELDVALISSVDLTKELKKAFEYDEAQKLSATRIKFLRTVATNEVAHALGQTMKHQLIKLAASSSDAPFLHGEQPWRNKWQATVSIQQDIEFALPVQQDFEGVVSLQQDIEFIVAIQESKQLIEEM